MKGNKDLPDKISTVILDFDGVLADSGKFHKNALQESAHKIGLELSDNDHHKYFYGASLQEGAERYLAANNLLDSLDLFIAHKKSFDSEYSAQIQPIAHALDFLSRIKDQYRLAICSGTRRLMVEMYIEKFELQNIFSAIVTSEDVKFSKPDPESYYKVLEKLQISNSEAVAIEDSVSGINSAQSAGIYTFGITTTLSPIEINQADKVVNNFTEILK